MLAVLLTAPLWLPLFMVMALLVKLTSRGPILFSQRRFGQGKKLFTMYKFRSMYVSAPANVPTHLLQDAKAHITPLGRIMRRLSLDELPQMMNILRGELSLVGPRPALYNQLDLIALRDKYGANQVPVGLTGLAQISGRDELPLDTKARLDGKYAANLSLWQDIYILWRTVRVAVTGRGIQR